MSSAVSTLSTSTQAITDHSQLPQSISVKGRDATHAAPPQYRGLAGALRRWLREPMLHFLIGGGVIFIGATAVEHFHNNATKVIAIDDALKNRLTKLYQLQMGTAPTASEFAHIIDTYIHDEVLYREALALGLDKGDEIIRRRLVQKMSFLQNDLTIAAEPDERTLRSYYQQHGSEFAESERVSFQQRFFSVDNNSADNDAAYQRAKLALARLNANPNAIVEADRAPLDAQYQRLGHRELNRLFGATPIVEQLLNAPVGTWSGPVRSGYGWHLVRIGERVESKLPSFEAVRDQVASVVSARIKEENNQRNFRDALARYDVRNRAESLLP